MRAPTFQSERRAARRQTPVTTTIDALIVLALVLLVGTTPARAARAYATLAGLFAAVRRAVCTAVGMGVGTGVNGRGDGAGESMEEVEPEVEDVEEVGLLPPAFHVQDYGRVESILATWHEEEGHRLTDLPAGLTNSGNTCFAAAALQCVYHTRLLTAHFKDEPHGECSVRGFCVMCEYQSHVRRALESEPQSSFSIGKLTSSIGKIAKHFVRGRQEDSHEYIRSLLDGIHVTSLKEVGGDEAEKKFDQRTQETTMVYHIFGGYVCGRVVCNDCGHESRTYQSMIDIPVDVSPRGVPSVESSMKSNFVNTETLDGSNKYKCGRCRAYVSAEKGAKIHVSPNVLILPLKRYTMGRFSKITKHVEFPLELDLTPYMSPDAPYEGNGPPVYTLYGVVVHLDWMGSAHSGHYISFVRLSDGRWCKCDDGRVEETDEATVLKQKAYLLFYERNSLRAALPVRTPEEQARVEELARLTKERTARVKARRAAAEAAKKAAASRKSARGKAPASATDDDEVEAEQTLTVPDHTLTFVGKQPASVISDVDSCAGEALAGGGMHLPQRPWPHRVICAVQLPTVSSAREVRVEQSSRELTVTVRRAHRRTAGNVALELALPYPVNSDSSDIIFDSSVRVLKLVMPVLPYNALDARHHGEWVAAWEAERAKHREAALAHAGETAAAHAKGKAVRLDQRLEARARARARLGARPSRGSSSRNVHARDGVVDDGIESSSTEWEETDGEHRDDDDDSATDSDDSAGKAGGAARLDTLAANMGLMRMGSPTTRRGAKSRNEGSAVAVMNESEDREGVDKNQEVEPLVNVLDRRDRTTGAGEIEVTVNIPGVTNAAEVEAELSEGGLVRNARVQTTLHVRVPGQYRADIPLPSGTSLACPPGKFNRRAGKITFTLPVEAHA